jgi:hypothetical protein
MGTSGFDSIHSGTMFCFSESQLVNQAGVTPRQADSVTFNLYLPSLSPCYK